MLMLIIEIWLCFMAYGLVMMVITELITSRRPKQKNYNTAPTHRRKTLVEMANEARERQKRSEPARIEPVLPEPLDNGVAPLRLDRGARLLKNIGRCRS